MRQRRRYVKQLCGAQNSNYLLRKTKLKAIFQFLLSCIGVRRTLNPLKSNEVNSPKWLKKDRVFLALIFLK